MTLKRWQQGRIGEESQKRAGMERGEASSRGLVGERALTVMDRNGTLGMRIETDSEQKCEAAMQFQMQFHTKKCVLRTHSIVLQI